MTLASQEAAVAAMSTVPDPPARRPLAPAQQGDLSPVRELEGAIVVRVVRSIADGIRVPVPIDVDEPPMLRRM
jgi:hypothetical protein